MWGLALVCVNHFPNNDLPIKKNHGIVYFIPYLNNIKPMYPIGSPTLVDFETIDLIRE